MDKRLYVMALALLMAAPAQANMVPQTTGCQILKTWDEMEEGGASCLIREKCPNLAYSDDTNKWLWDTLVNANTSEKECDDLAVIQNRLILIPTAANTN